MRARIGILLLPLLAWIFVACSQKPAASAGAESSGTVPKWEGLWIGENQQPEINGFPAPGGPPMQQLYRLAGFEAPWNEEGRAKFGALLAATGGRKAQGWGYPMMMNSSAPMQFIITPEQVLILNIYRDVRQVFTDGRKHPPEEDRWATTWGDSIGHWEGDTLVIETVSVKYPPDYFFLAPPLSEQARFVERLRRTAPDRIESEITIEDPATLTQPWKVSMVYRRPEGVDRLILEGFDNDRTGFDGEVMTIEGPK